MKHSGLFCCRTDERARSVQANELLRSQIYAVFSVSLQHLATCALPVVSDFDSQSNAATARLRTSARPYCFAPAASASAFTIPTRCHVAVSSMPVRCVALNKSLSTPGWCPAICRCASHQAQTTTGAPAPSAFKATLCRAGTAGRGACLVASATTNSPAAGAAASAPSARRGAAKVTWISAKSAGAGTGTTTASARSATLTSARYVRGGVAA